MPNEHKIQSTDEVEQMPNLAAVDEWLERNRNFAKFELEGATFITGGLAKVSKSAYMRARRPKNKLRTDP